MSADFEQYVSKLTDATIGVLGEARKRCELEGGGELPVEKIPDFIAERNEAALNLGLSILQAAGGLTGQTGVGCTNEGTPVAKQANESK